MSQHNKLLKKSLQKGESMILIYCKKFMHKEGFQNTQTKSFILLTFFYL